MFCSRAFLCDWIYLFSNIIKKNTGAFVVTALKALLKKIFNIEIILLGFEGISIVQLEIT